MTLHFKLTLNLKLPAEAIDLESEFGACGRA